LPETRQILVVDDDPDMRTTLRAIFERESYRVVDVATGTEMHDELSRGRTDLVVLDLMLDYENGLSLAKEIREVSDIPIMIVTGKDDVIEKIVGLEIGADDYVTKPFHPRELTARVRSLLRRCVKEEEDLANDSVSAGSSIAKFDGWSFNLDSGELLSNSGESVVLTSLEAKFLEIFVKNSGQNLTRDRIMTLVSDRDWNPFDRSIDVTIAKLRKKLGDDVKNPHYIRTQRGIGYRFIARTIWN
jgi:two-component system phosphate regulon response regulator OmpR